MIQASYARFAEGEFAATVEAAEDVHVDISADRTVLGIEVIGGTDWQRGLVALAMAGRLRVAPPEPISTGGLKIPVTIDESLPPGTIGLMSRWHERGEVRVSGAIAVNVDPEP